MNAKELIEDLKQIPEDTEIALWNWDGKQSIYRQLTSTCNAYNKKRKLFTLSTPIPESIDPIYLDNKEV